jgi:phosphate transport system substrate-binding protein
MSSMSRLAFGKAALTAVLVGVALPLANAFAAPTPPPIIIDGSTTVYPINAVAQYVYAGFNPGTTFTLGYTGSGHGQTSILNDYVHIGVSSSPCSGSNAFQTTEGSYTSVAGSYHLTASPSTFTCAQVSPAGNVAAVAKDALTIIVHPSKTCITSITVTQTKQIWEGTITDWSALGCPAAPLTPRARIIGSGTRASFDGFAGIVDATEQSRIAATGLGREQGNSQMEQDIAANPNQIGYTSLAFESAVRALDLVCGGWTGGANNQCRNGNPAAPTAANALTDDYPMARNLWMFTSPTPLASVTAYVNWIKGPLGQAIVKNVGYVPLFPVAPNWDVDGNHSADIGDVGIIGAYWNLSGPADGNDPEHPIVRGWSRADVTFDGTVNINDIATFGAFWNQSW